MIPSSLFEDSLDSMMATRCRDSRISGVCWVKSACLPLNSPIFWMADASSAVKCIFFRYMGCSVCIRTVLRNEVMKFMNEVITRSHYLILPSYYHVLCVLVSTTNRLCNKPLRELENLLDLGRLEYAPDSLRMDPGEGRIDKVFFFDPTGLQDEGLEDLKKTDLK